MPTGRIRRRRRALPRAAYILTTAALLAGSATGVYGALELQALRTAYHHRHPAPMSAKVKLAADAPESHEAIARNLP